MVREIWEANSTTNNKFYFIIDALNFSVYTKHLGVRFFDNKIEAKKELEKVKNNDTIGFWLGAIKFMACLKHSYSRKSS